MPHEEKRPIKCYCFSYIFALSNKIVMNVYIIDISRENLTTWISQRYFSGMQCVKLLSWQMKRLYVDKVS